MITLTPNQSRYLALALLVGAVLATLAALAWPWMLAYTDQASRIDHRHRQIAAFSRLAASQASMQQELAQLQRRNPAATYYVTGETTALAGANMQRYVKQIIERNGGEVISTQIVEQEEEQISAGLRVVLRTDVASSSRILYQLEHGRPLLFLDNLTISTRLTRGTTPSLAPKVSLDMTFDVTGYFREGA